MLLLNIAILLLMMLNILRLLHSRLALFMVSICASLIVVIASFVVIWTKYGGGRTGVELMLYLNAWLGRKLLYLPVGAAALSQWLIGSKSLFLGALLAAGVYLCQSLGAKLRLFLYTLAVSVALLHYVLLSPAVYGRYSPTAFFSQYQVQIFNLIRVFYCLWLVGCMALLVWHYGQIRIAWIKTSFYYIALLYGYWCFLFVLFAVLGPIQVSVYTGIYYIRSNFVYMQGYWFWLVLTLLSFVFAVVGARALWRYSQIYQTVGLPDVKIRQKMKDNNASVRMFIHGMKNQFLVQQTMIQDTLEEIELPSQAVERLQEILSSNPHMTGRVNQLYAAFKEPNLILTVVDEPRSIAQQALELVGKREVPIRIECQQQHSILADGPYLAEALANLIVNGVEAIQFKDVVSPADQVLVRLYLDRGHYVFEVVDTGIGMTKKELRHIFEPFYTKKNSRTNWGVGLSYVQEIVRGHYGALSMNSRMGEGTCVYVSVPLYGK